MNKKWNGRKIFHKCVLVLLIIAMGDFLFSGRSSVGEGEGEHFSWKEVFAARAQEGVLNIWLPSFAFADKGSASGRGWFEQILGQQVPLFAYAGSQDNENLQTESGSTYEKILLLEGASEYTESEDGDALEVPETSEGKIRLDDNMTQLLQEENQTGQDQDGEQQEVQMPAPDQFGFIKAAGRSQEYNWSYYQDFDALIKEFYAVDATTEANPKRLNLDALLGKTMAITKNPDVPQILIYHTHSQEEFSDYGPDNKEATVIGIGNYLTELLTAKGYHVIHDKSVYDLQNGKLDRNKAYTYALDGVTRILQENPSIEVILDLHRDGVNESLHMVNEVNGKPTAPIMFFNGVSQTPEGPIEYLPNPYRSDNLAFSFQMQLDAAAYFPGLTRKIYIKGLRYNLHLRPRSVLIEVGAQTNTYQEARNAMEPLAEVLNMVLQGN